MNHNPNEKICLIGLGQVYESIAADLHAYASPDTHWLFRPIGHVSQLESCADSVLSSIPQGVSLFVAVDAIALNYARMEIFVPAQERGLPMANLIHKGACCSPDVRLGCNVWVGPGAVIDYQAEIGDNVMINPMARIDPQARIGNHGWIGRGTSVGSCASLGNNCIIGDDVHIKAYTSIGRQCAIAQPGAWSQNITDGTFVEKSTWAPSRIIGKGYTFNTSYHAEEAA